MNVPEGQPRIAQRFNAGFAFAKCVESRRDGRNDLPSRSDFFRPSGAYSVLFALPTVETVGYCSSPQAGLVDRILAAKARDAGADVSTLEREIDQRVYRLYGLTPDEIKLVEETAG